MPNQMKIYIVIFSILLISCHSKEENIISKEVQNSEKGISSTQSRIFKFEKFPIEVYKGKLAKPNFKNTLFSDDKEFVDLISKGCKKTPVNFAGHFTVLTKSCGMYCEHLFLIDRKTGKIFIENFPNEAIDGFEYNANSKLFIINSNSLDENLTTKERLERFPPEYYIWENDNFKRLK
jgi:hypothetical protein